MQGGISVGNEALSLSGDGIGGTGALRGVSGSNAWAGPVSLSDPDGVNIGVDAGSQLTLSGVISGDTGLVKRSPGKLVLTAANTYPGSTNVHDGILNIQHASALGSANPAFPTIVSDPGILEIQGGIAVGTETLILNENLAIQGPLRNVSGSNSWDGAVRLNSGVDFRIIVDQGSQLTLNGIISPQPVTGNPNAGLFKLADGTLVLTAANTYKGTTTVAAGTLLVQGSQPDSPVLVNQNDARLGGSGTVGAIAASALSFVSPGSSPGILHAAGDVAFQSATTFVVELNGTTAGSGYDQLDVKGRIDLGGSKLSATLGFASAADDEFVIIQNDGSEPITGTFFGLGEGDKLTIGGQLFQISYRAFAPTGNDVVLRHIKPPSGGLQPRGDALVDSQVLAWLEQAEASGRSDRLTTGLEEETAVKDELLPLSQEDPVRAGQLEANHNAILQSADVEAFYQQFGLGNDAREEHIEGLSEFSFVGEKAAPLPGWVL
ncbi:MAG: autotransporter-associated beta strand repeat-containing protein [Gemmataceae bacterium]|nr:autotransporter-associated beta strand repeat-containing protein [Gemmataceae bacterium]